MTCDVVIPVYNNAETLPLLLEALFNQDIPAGWQLKVVLSDDGSSDDSVAIAQKHCEQSGWNFEILKNEHRGIAATRNAALEKSNAVIIFFLNADIILKPGALATHLNFHQQNVEVGDAAIGFINWDPRINPSPLQEWMTHGGPQNNFDAILGVKIASTGNFFNAAFSSIKSEILKDNKFSEDFSLYGWEEHELADRLKDKGLVLHVLDQARALHHHKYTTRSIIQRQVNAGKSMNVYRELSSDNHYLPEPTEKRRKKANLVKYSGFLSFATLVLSSTEKWLFSPWLYKGVAYSYFWEGVFHRK